MPVCPNCGSSIKEGVYCPYCGSGIIGSVTEIKNRKFELINFINSKPVIYDDTEYLYRVEILKDRNTNELFVRFSYLFREVGSDKWKWGSKREPILKLNSEFKDLINKLLNCPEIREITNV